MNALIGLGGTLTLLAVAGGIAGLTDRTRFSLRWLLIAIGLVAANDLLLTRAWGLIPNVLGSGLNWQGKFFAIVGTLAIAALPVFGWRRIGLRLDQAPGSLRPAVPLVLVYCAFFIGLALIFPNDLPDSEDIAF